MGGALSRAVSGFCLLVFFLWGAAFLGQRALMYHPDPAPFDPDLIGATQLEPVSLSSLRHFYAPPAAPRVETIVYFQGNAGGLANRAHKYLPWLAQGKGVFLVGYAGYGNKGAPTEENLYRGAREALDWLYARAETSPVVLYGESLGTGVAVQMALDYGAIAALILEAPYTSYPDAGAFHYPYLPVRLLAVDRYETMRKMDRVRIPLLVIHGTEDRTVPFAQGQKVFESAKGPKKMLRLEGAGHGNLYDFGAGEAVDKFLFELFSGKSF